MQIADALIADIVDWRYAPGSWIREREIAERFGVSHAPVREAFRHVAREGFVVVVPWRGVRVVDIGVETAEDIFELWIATFSAICGMAADRMALDEHVTMLGLFKGYEDSIETTADTVEHTRRAYAVGRYIAECARAPLITENLQRVGRLARWQHAMLPVEQFEALDRAPGRESVRRLRMLCGALVARDRAAASREAREFLTLSGSYIVDAIARRHAEAKNAAVAEPVPPVKPSRRSKSAAD